jgi:hypothetical protein
MPEELSPGTLYGNSISRPNQRPVTPWNLKFREPERRQDTESPGPTPGCGAVIKFEVDSVLLKIGVLTILESIKFVEEFKVPLSPLRDQRVICIERKLS